MSIDINQSRFKVVVSGKVQGVFFRACTKEEADKLCLRGWVSNQPNGSVCAEIEGDSKETQIMLNWFSTGSPMSKVTNIEIDQIEVLNSETGFVIRY